METMFKMSYLVCFVFCFLIFIGCKLNIKPSTLRIKEDLLSMCKVKPIPPKSEEENRRELVDNRAVVITREYKTRLRCSEVKKHYQNTFLKEGWKPVENVGYEFLFPKSNKTIIEFRNDEYLIGVSCDDSMLIQARFSLSCSWGIVGNE